MRRASLLTLFLIVFIDMVGFGIVLPNQQFYGEVFGIQNKFALVMIGATYSLFQFVFSPILGRWSDRAGRRPVLIFSQIGTLVGFVLLFASFYVIPFSGAAAIFLLYFSRVLDGISGGNISIAFAYAADVTTPENRAKGVGTVGAALGVGFVFGPAIGGVVGKHMGLQFVPVTAAVFSLAALICTMLYLPESLEPAKRLKVAAHVAATMFHAALDRMFMMRHALMRPVIGGLIAMGFVNGFAFAGMEQTFSLIIQERTRLGVENSAGAAGYLFGMIGVIILIFQGGLIGRLTKAFGEAPFVIIGPFLIAAGFACIAVAGIHVSTWTGLITGSALMAIGQSIFSPSVSSLISRHARDTEQGEVMGANSGMQALARGVGPILAGALFWAISSQAPYFASAGICLLVSVFALGWRKHLRPPISLDPVPAAENRAEVSGE